MREHTLTFRRISDDAKNYFYIGSAAFRVIDSLPTVDAVVAESSRDTLSAGESAKLTAGVRMTDGSYLNLGKSYAGGDDANNSLSIQAKNPDILALEGGILRAVKPGTGVIAVNAVIGGKAQSAECTVTVDSERLARVSLSIEPAELYPGESGALSVAAFTESGRQLNPEDLTIATASDAPAVIQVDGLKATAQSAGRANISAVVTLAAYPKPEAWR